MSRSRVIESKTPRSRSPTGIACLIFDCDGVLVDSEAIAARVAAECFRESGIQITAERLIARFAGVAGQTISEILCAESGMIGAVAMTEARGHRVMAAFNSELMAMPGVAAALGAISLPKCVASSSQLERIRCSLDIAGLSRFFGDAVFSASQVKSGKPAPDLFLLAATRMGVDPRSCVVVEDSVVGVEAGIAAGIPVLGFAGGSHCGYYHHAKLVAAGAIRVISHMDELLLAIAEI